MENNSQQTIKTHNTVLIIVSISCFGASLEGFIQGWELWVPPLLALAVIGAWWMHITQRGDSKSRENYYLYLSIFMAFFHGMHTSSFFDVAVVSSLLLGTFTLLNNIAYLRIVLAEYFIVTIIQVVAALVTGSVELDSFTIARMSLHLGCVFCIYSVLKKLLLKSIEDRKVIEKKDSDKESYDHNMEDFLVNISHELRTPVNVINGLSSLILKRENREDVKSIRNAGLRLARQIEDIQDYSEVQRNDLRIENERYMITSILNDILSSYADMEKIDKIDFIVDLDPAVPAVMKGDANKIRKVIEHLLDNAFKFTKRGGVRLRIFCIRKEYGVNLLVEVTDTGIGMTQKDIESVSLGSYQADRKRTRSTGGIGLGLSIVYGFIRNMDGFVRINSEKRKGTVVRLSVFQEIIDPAPCMSVTTEKFVNIICYVAQGSHREPYVASMYSDMARNLAAGLRVNMYFANSEEELKRLISRGDITNVFTGPYEYTKSCEYLDELAKKGITVAVSADKKFSVRSGSEVVIISKPVYGYQIVQVLNEEFGGKHISFESEIVKPDLSGIKALVVDDEPMNLVVAMGILKDYKMIIDTADSGKESIEKFSKKDYDVILMDHMMPGMDGVEAMKRIRSVAEQENRKVKIIAFTANAVSGAKEMFLREGFDGFISKPIKMHDFERVMARVMFENKSGWKGGAK